MARQKNGPNNTNIEIFKVAEATSVAANIHVKKILTKCLSNIIENRFLKKTLE